MLSSLFYSQMTIFFLRYCFVKYFWIDLYGSNVDKQNYPFCRLKLLVENFGTFTFGTKLSQFNKNTQSFWEIEIGQGVVKILGTTRISSPMSYLSLKVMIWFNFK